MQDILQQLLEAARTAGPFGALIMTVLWWLERAERIRVQARNEALVEKYEDKSAALTEKVFTVQTGTTSTLQALTNVLEGRGKR